MYGKLIIASLLTISGLSAGAQKDTSKTCNDSTRMKFKSFDLIVIEKNPDCDRHSTDTAKAHKAAKHNEKFSNWAGIYVGVNGFMTNSGSLNLGEENKFIALDYSRSVTWGINFAEAKFKIVPHHVGLTTGMGIQFNRYGLKNNYNLKYNSDSIYGVYDSSVSFNRNRLRATYLQVPLLLEFKTGKSMRKSFHLAIGVVGGYKIGSSIKQEFEVAGDEYENKTKGHFQLNPFQAYATARIGYGKGINAFINYGLTEVFEPGKGPRIKPFTIGLYLPF